MSVEEAIENHTVMAVDEMKRQLGDKWDLLTDAQQASAARASERVVKLEWKKRVNGEDIDEDLAFVVATIGEFKMAGEVALYDAFWSGVTKALEALGSFLAGAGMSLIPGLGTLVAGIDLGSILSE